MGVDKTVGGALGPIVVIATLAGLFISRTALVLHEMIGHGGMARLLGARITDYRLFWFGGGRIHYEFPSRASHRELLLVALAGIALELVLGAILLALHRRIARPLPRFVVFAFGATVALHGLFYLVEGTHYGYGDARDLHEMLGASRPWPIAAGSALLAALAFFTGGRLSAFIEGWLGPRSRRERLLVFASMVVVAGGVHWGLTRLETALTQDEAYARIFRSQAVERAKAQAERELAERLAQLRARGEDASAAEQERIRDELARRHRPFPLRPILYALIPLGLVLGLVRRARAAAATATPLGWSSAKWMALATALSFVLVALLRTP
jgi:hypothetical protein